MFKQEWLDYERHIDAIMIQNDVLDIAKMEGRAEGRAEGILIGEEKGMKETARKFKEVGAPIVMIMHGYKLI